MASATVYGANVAIRIVGGKNIVRNYISFIHCK